MVLGWEGNLRGNLEMGEEDGQKGNISDVNLSFLVWIILSWERPAIYVAKVKRGAPLEVKGFLYIDR